MIRSIQIQVKYHDLNSSPSSLFLTSNNPLFIPIRLSVRYYEKRPDARKRASGRLKPEI
ncbi:MAG: hypothetical protein AAGH79_10955 [Bacteroidota bacterium]